jgi:hypothetical protein
MDRCPLQWQAARQWVPRQLVPSPGPDGVRLGERFELEAAASTDDQDASIERRAIGQEQTWHAMQVDEAGRSLRARSA